MSKGLEKEEEAGGHTARVPTTDDNALRQGLDHRQRGSPPTRIGQHILTAVVLLVLGVNVWWFLGGGSTGPHPLDGKIAPSFALPTIDRTGNVGGKVTLADHQGKVVLLDFWATHCPPCRKQMPVLEKLHGRLKKDQFAILSVNLDDLPFRDRTRVVGAFLAEGGYTFTVLLGTGRASAAYRVRRIPTLVLVGPDGRVGFTHSGFCSETKLEKEIQRLLDPSAKEGS